MSLVKYKSKCTVIPVLNMSRFSVHITQKVTLLTDIWTWEKSFFAILGDVLDLDYIFGGMRGKQFLLTAASIFPVVWGYF